MDEKLTENQLDVLCVLWNQAYDFLDLCEETDHFVWPTTDLRCVPVSLSFVSVRMPKSSAGAVTQRRP